MYQSTASFEAENGLACLYKAGDIVMLGQMAPNTKVFVISPWESIQRLSFRTDSYQEARVDINQLNFC